ncbi:transcription-associated protein 1 [Exophiala dermatitidis]|uniref:Transformation/transcription domain-associated protein n=2 Tax=Exophiala dermatitidis TaxID=5970 RepID=H6BQ25_EXODN|nr:transformation/transcription domain-associated protein [Exophiala dermatitidis NIH/UT8656]KAJ4511554.1 transcription-associated protein 1 [Exophiala dermatitidis]EHY54471.1 transformation/transcription domain-associated protein [Exophiala dermatitidis NIH/UT8656]KAJ4521287.1 transcription-associated protein 1 [Exophiala dermatitidis]KAJ4541952.1 transcription-associated protein 1 [Exophiala dermatitidis]KAJ4544718.1 transcription-associated protein 1 [Exophiala dermatitidis]
MSSTMDASQKIDLYAARLSDPKIDTRTKSNIATELRDSTENLCSVSATYTKFLTKLWPVFKKILEGKPDFNPASFEHVLRNQILEILHRLQHGSAEFEPYALDIVETLMELVRVENEDNAVLCLKTIMDIERHQPTATASKVQPFLDLIQEMFELMEQVVRETFDSPVSHHQATSSTPHAASQTFQSPRPGSPATTVSDPGTEKREHTPLAKGMHSFKVLSECPIIVVSIFQAHRNTVSANVKKFVPSIKGILLLQAKAQEKAHAEAAANKTVFTGVSKEIKNRAAFGDFITAQVKTMSFLAYLLRVYANQLTDFLPTLPTVVVRLLKDCPREKSGARKELLVAIRHIINFNYRKIFLNKIDELLDERILIGDGLTVYETMRPLAYSMLADLIHHVRDSLDRNQIRRTIEVYTKNLHDNFPGTSFQTMSAKLLLNMAESITKLENKEEARYFLIMILDAIGDKFAAMNYQYNNAVKLSKQYADKTKENTTESYMDDKEQIPDWDEVDIFNATPIKTSNPRERGADPVGDNKFLFKNLVNGLKNMFYQLKTCNPPGLALDQASAPMNWSEVSFGYNAEETRVITKLFHEGARVFRYYSAETPVPDLQYSSPVEFMASHSMAQMTRDEKELLESFGTVFHYIDPATFHEVFQAEIPYLHELMFEHTALLHLPQFFLASEATSPAFAGMVLQYLMNKLPEVGSSDIVRSSILLRMFKLSFMAVTLFSAHNEQVLLPHITKIITQCVQLSVTAEKPIHYFILLRSLFRSIGGGRFELLYKEILPLLEMLLETFNHLLQGARDPHDRDLYVELTLTVPARLSHLLPHLNHLMRPLVVALRAGPDLVGQGLRTLELCVDNLTADYLDPIMAPIMDDLMTALFEHLKPQPYQHFHSHTTMRILGKLGGRNRKYLNHPHQLTYRRHTDDEPSFDIRLVDTIRDRAFPLDTGVDLAIRKLGETTKNPKCKALDAYYKQQSFKLITTQVKLLIGYDHIPDDLSALLRLQANDLLARRFTTYADMLADNELSKSVLKRREQEETLKKLLKACFTATTVQDLKPQAEAFIQNIARHFTIVELGQALCDAGRRTKEFDVNLGEGAVHLSTKVLADVICYCLASDNIVIREAAEAAIVATVDAARTIFGGEEKAARLPFFSHLIQTFCHRCREVEWFTKAGATLGIQIVITKLDLGIAFLSSKQLEIIKALLFVIKDTPQEVPASTRITAQDTLEFILRKVCVGQTREMLANDKSTIHALSITFCVELCHMNKHTRDTAQRAFSVMAEVVGVEVHELIAPVKERLLQPIFNKPLRALPFLSQTGFIDAITYCLSLGHDLVPLNDQLNRLMMESLALADADAEILHPRPDEYNNAQLIVNLRVSCLRLLSLAMSLPDFATGPQNTSRARIITVFFKLLYSKSPEIIEAANAGLKEVLVQTTKLPKDLLQNGLRPILMNLQDSKRLTVAGLEGLARLLTLLTNYFKVEIGGRLLEHMRAIADDQLLQRVSFTLIEQNPQMKIVTAIVNIFHLLPPAATSFMPDLINNVLDLETKLRRTVASPFRHPLILYLDKYPQETCSFFQSRLQDEKYGRFFGQLLASPSSPSLRDAVMKNTEALVKAAFEVEKGPERQTAAINGIYVVHSVCQFDAAKDWLRGQEQLRVKVLGAGRELEQQLRGDLLQPSQRLRAEQAGDHLMDILTHYLASALEDLDFMMEVFSSSAQGQIKTPLKLTKFLFDSIITDKSTTRRFNIVEKCLEIYSHKTEPHKVKTFLLHDVVNPIMARDVQNTRRGDNEAAPLADHKLFNLFLERLWKPAAPDASEDLSQPGIDHSRMEALQLSAFVLKYHKDAVSEDRKEIIKYSWGHIRLEDVITKYAAYVLICYFIRSYDTPPKIAVQIYNQLLKAHQNEGKALVTQALEVLAPVLPARMGGTSNAPGDKRSSSHWARLPRKILNEETGNLQQVQSIFNFIVRQPDLFYDSREFFVSTIIQMLHKIAPPPNTSNENKKLALALISLLLHWETRRVSAGSSPHLGTEPSPSLKRDSSGTQLLQPPPPKERAEYQIPLELRTLVVKYMITFITTLPERFPVPAAELKAKTMQKAQQQALSNDLVKKAVQLLRDLLAPNLWADVDVGLYEKLLDPILSGEKADKADEKQLTCMINALQVMRILLSTKSDDWIINHMEKIQKLLDKPLKMEEPEIQDCLHTVSDDSTSLPLVRRVLEAIPKQRAEDEDGMELDVAPSDFPTRYSKVLVGEALSSGNYISGINNLWTLSLVRPADVDDHVNGAMKALQQKLAKEHINAYVIPPGPPPQGWRLGEPLMDPYEFALGVDLIKKTIDILSSRMAELNEQRRPFLSVLASLVEKSFNVELCSKVLDMVEKWVFNSNEPWPTLKEKTAVLHKMLVFEKWPTQTLLERFLELVIKIYEDPTVTRTELTVRLEHAFLIGTRAKDVEMRNRFMNIFNRALSKTASYRLNYVLTLQNWDTLADSFWLKQASHLIMGSVEMSMPARLHPEDVRVCPLSQLFGTNLVSPEQRKDDLLIEDNLEALVAAQRRFNQEIHEVKVRDLLDPITQLQHTDDNLAYDVWVKLFPLCWSALNKDERLDLEKGMVTLLTREYHQRQLNLRPNVVQALLEGAVRARPRFKVPPHVMKFLSRTYDAWYTALVYLEEAAVDPLIDTAQVRESNLDALVEVYAGLQEDDLFYGTWRRRCKFMETNAALSYEQHGMWDKAQQLWESAQVKARTGVVPFSQGEYYLWEDHWMICAQKLQQWDILGEFAKHENFSDLLLESAWRNYEAWSGDENRNQLDSMIKSVSDAPTPRRTFFQAFMALLRYNSKQVSRAEFQHVCDEAIQLSIRKWHQLPKRITNAHIPILQNFQQLVELHDASVICDSLMGTNERNLDSKSQEVKLLLQAWRDRLPNIWDDINAWQDLVTWRQHVFQLVNSTYLPLIPQGGNNVGSNSYAFRGYHETAWIINKFAHVARKHQMPEVCISQLGKIYTLPNIEIQEAFLKLREQAKCHYQNKAELNNGLDVINNTNLNYFGAQQKAEFYTLKGMFLAKLQHVEEANEAFGVALYYDLRLPKAWAEWGQYSDRKFKENPNNIESASNAVSCYLEAAGLYKSAKSRKMLSRVLWLLSLDDDEGHIAKAFEDFKGETPVWYWTTFIPQLLGSLEHKEARLTRTVLVKIAKAFPQALFYHLRATREEFLTKKKQLESQRRQVKVQQEKAEANSRPGTANGASSPKPKQEPNGDAQTSGTEVAPKEEPKKPWDYTDEIMSGLKTAFPLLALSMETMTDQLSKHFKCPPDEDAHRLIVALLNDGLAYISRAPLTYAEGAKLPPSTEANIARFVTSVLPAHIRKSFEADFVQTRPTMFEYIHKLRRWRDKFEQKLDHRQQWAPLESYSHHLSEFKFLKFDDSVEVPGQYQQHKDKNTDFVRIERFMPTVELVRGNSICHRRLTMRGHDGSLHPFAVQHPTGGKVRREERIVQLFRIFNQTLAKRKESRRRNLYFHLPIFVPIAPYIRLVQDDSSYVTLQTVYEDYVRKTPGMSRDDPMLFILEKSRAIAEQQKTQPRTPDQLSVMKTEIFNTIQERWVPNTIALQYFQATYPSFADFWLFRRQFAYQFAATTFMTYIMHMSARYPMKYFISRATGDIWASDLLPNLNSARAYFFNPEAVPFRLTPNIQTLMGPLAVEGIFTASLMAIARCLAEQDQGYEMEQQLSIFVRDEMYNWATNRSHSANSNEPKMEGQHLRELVAQNVDFIVRRALTLAKTQGSVGTGAEGGVNGVLPACQNVVDLVSRATDPMKLSAMDGLWMPWL